MLMLICELNIMAPPLRLTYEHRKPLFLTLFYEQRYFNNPKNLYVTSEHIEQKKAAVFKF